MTTPPGWPAPGDEVVVWHEVSPSRQPREPHAAVVAHVGLRTFHVHGSDATFNRSTGRAHPSGAGLAKRTYVAVPAGSDRATAALGADRQRTTTDAAVRAAQAWLADRSEANRRALVDALAEMAPDQG